MKKTRGKIMKELTSIGMPRLPVPGKMNVAMGVRTTVVFNIRMLQRWNECVDNVV